MQAHFMPKTEQLFWKIIFHGKSCIYKSKIAKFHHMKIQKTYAIPWADFEKNVDSSIFASFENWYFYQFLIICQNIAIDDCWITWFFYLHYFVFKTFFEICPHKNSKNDKMTTLEILIKQILHFDDLTHTGTQYLGRTC